jgi:hypothetical protein
MHVIDNHSSVALWDGLVRFEYLYLSYPSSEFMKISYPGIDPLTPPHAH